MDAPHRLVALAAVRGVLSKAIPPEQAISSHPDTPRLEPRDRAFALAIAAETIRRIGAIDCVLEQMLEKPISDHAHRACNILRCGTAELLILKTPPHAAVDSWTTIMGGAKESAKFRKLCNAVLRRVSREGASILETIDPIMDLPDWIAHRWIKAYGEAVTRAIAVARQTKPPLDLTFKPGLNLSTVFSEFNPDVLPTGSLRLKSPGDVTALPGYETGDWWIQDAAAAIPVRLLNLKPGERVADLCAAPGGKTMQIAASGASVLAIDRSNNRLKQVEDNLARTRLTAETICADAEEWTSSQPLDAILLDAPCSATGTIRKHPETVWIKSEADIQKLAALQSRLLDASLNQLKSGGRLVYCTCSLEPEEGEDQVRDLLKRRTDVQIDPVQVDEIRGLEDAISPEGWVRTRPDQWPDLGGLDGFFMVRLRKT